ncbi:hypothetical protein V5799_020305 [Amblyomma americanum]|uniref:Uncharacterized protein n=1 Tax=Amblyomma americanum TaxID=6943 RepID=A0AAQ4EV48_AMBAM
MSVVHLEVNQYRLVTGYDFHATLLSPVDLPSLQRTRRTRKGLSILGVVPPQRTCADAILPGHFCACLDPRKPMDNSAQAEEVGQFCLAYINEQAEAHFPRLCQWRSLTDVDGLEILGGDVAGKVMFRLKLAAVPAAHFKTYGTIGSARQRIEIVQWLDTCSNGTKCLRENCWQYFWVCK